MSAQITEMMSINQITVIWTPGITLYDHLKLLHVLLVTEQIH